MVHREMSSILTPQLGNTLNSLNDKTTSLRAVVSMFKLNAA